MKLFLLISCLFLLLLPQFMYSVAAQEDTASLDINGYRWGKTTINVLLTTAENESWWRPYFVNLTFNGVNQWNFALNSFSKEYSAYSYLSQVKLGFDVTNESQPGYDIYIHFSNIVDESGVLGLTRTSELTNKTVKNIDITLITESKYTELSRSDLRDIVTHELGHALGLGHSNSSKDLMYPTYDLASTDNAISTLDLYGLAKCFSWISPIVTVQNTKQSQFQSVSLPQGITYEYTPVVNPPPREIADIPPIKFVAMLLSNHAIAIMAIALIIFVTLVWLVIERDNRRLKVRKRFRYN